MADVLDQHNVKYQLNAMATTLEGDWEKVLDAIHACHRVVRRSHARVLTTITVDDDTTRPLHIAESTAKVVSRLTEVPS